MTKRNKQKYALAAAVLVLTSIYVVPPACAQLPSVPTTPVYKEPFSRPTVEFFAGNQDIPVMPGLAELEGESFTYDKPEGDITEIVARMEGVNSRQVLYYYGATLPQFGWNRVIDAGDGHFFRQDEYLDISFDQKDGQDFVKIMIRPSR